MADETLRKNVDEHFGSPETADEWAMSVASVHGVPHAEVVAQAPTITQRTYCWTTAGRLIDAGYPVVEDEPPHALVLLPGPVTAEMAEELRTLFDGHAENPYYMERKRHGGRR